MSAIDSIVAAELNASRTAEAETTHRGHTVADLRETFDALTAGANWKDEIYATVSVADLGRIIAAAEWFAGSEVIARSDVRETPDGAIIDVYIPGYYLRVGA